MAKTAAFFDIDGTLLKENTNLLYLRSLLKYNKIGIGTIMRGIYYDILYKLDKLSIDELSHRGMSFMKGWEVKEIKEYCKAHFEKDVKPRLSKKMMRLIESHRKKKQMIVFLTASSSLTTENLAKYLRADQLISSELEEKKGILTGRFKKLCYEDNKYRILKAFAKKRKIDLKKSYFYTDSYTDIETLESVGNQMVVNPDRKLRKCAKKNNWKIIEN